MRTLCAFAVLGALVLVVGCGSEENKAHEGPKVDAFTGRLVHNGQPVSFPANEEVSLKIFHEKGQSFGIPIKSDGTFNIGWMLIGKYSAMLERPPKDAKGPPRKYSVPGGFAVVEGKTEYKIELGPGWQP